MADSEQTGKQVEGVTIRDRSGRRRFMRNGAGLLLGGSVISGAAQAQSDCDQYARNGQQADQDSGENADRKDCQGRNIVSENQPQRSAPVKVRRIKG